MAVRLGQTQKNVINYLATHPKTNAFTIQQALDKPHPSYITNALKGLIQNGLVIEMGAYTSTKNIETKNYGLTSKGLGLAIIELDYSTDLIRTAFEAYKGFDEEAAMIYKIIKAVDAELGPENGFMGDFYKNLATLLSGETEPVQAIYMMMGLMQLRLNKKQIHRIVGKLFPNGVLPRS